MNIYLLLAMAILSPSALEANEIPPVIAHRGASADAPENTIPAFMLAWQKGADGIEGDFHLTKDGEIVCIHDGNTRKVAEQNLVVSDSTLAELRTLDVGAYRGEEFAGTRIPTIRQVLAIVPEGKRVYIEVKCGVEIIPALLAAIGESGLADGQVVLISFKQQIIAEFKSKAPQFDAYWLCNFRQNDSGEVLPSIKAVLDTLAEIDADGLGASTDMPRKHVRALRASGFQWHVWTVNDSRVAERMAALGTDSITTDVPGLIREHLARKGFVRWMKK